MPTTRHRRTRAIVNVIDDDMAEFLKTGKVREASDILWDLFESAVTFKCYDEMKARMGAVEIKRTKAYRVLEQGVERFENYSWISHDAYMRYQKTGYIGD